LKSIWATWMALTVRRAADRLARAAAHQRLLRYRNVPPAPAVVGSLSSAGDSAAGSSAVISGSSSGANSSGAHRRPAPNSRRWSQALRTNA
jgi:hypothetical protein